MKNEYNYSSGYHEYMEQQIRFEREIIPRLLHEIVSSEWAKILCEEWGKRLESSTVTKS